MSMVRSAVPRDDLSMTHSTQTRIADAIIVGAGVVGSSIALSLSRAGLGVLVLDGHRGPGQGSTAASSAVVRFNYSTFAGVATAWESKLRWEDWTGHLGAVDPDGMSRFHRTGMVALDVDLAPKARIAGLFDRVGVPYEDWDAQMLGARIPGLDIGRYWPPRALDDESFWDEADEELGALWTPDAGYVDDPSLAARNLAHAAAELGARFRFATTVTAVTAAEGRIRGVEVDGQATISAPIVVNAAGPWSSGLNALAGATDDFTITTRPMRQEVHRVSAPSGYGSGVAPAGNGPRGAPAGNGPGGDSGDGYGPGAGEGPIIADMDLGTYIRPAAGGGLYIGGTEPDCDELQWLSEPEAADLRPTRQVFDSQVARAAKRLPDLGVPSRPSGIVGVYDVSSDWAPIYDRTAIDGYYVAIGTSGNQFKTAPVIGDLMAAIITAVENGHDHDSSPVVYAAPRSGLSIDTGAYSRRRPVNPDSSGTVMG